MKTKINTNVQNNSDSGLNKKNNFNNDKPDHELLLTIAKTMKTEINKKGKLILDTTTSSYKKLRDKKYISIQSVYKIIDKYLGIDKDTL